MGLYAHKSAALSCIAFSYAAQIQPTPTQMSLSFSYDQSQTYSGLMSIALYQYNILAFKLLRGLKEWCIIRADIAQPRMLDNLCT